LKDKDRNTSIFLASLYNVGNKEAEEVDCVLRIPKAKIVSHGVNPSAIKHDYKEDGDSATVHIGLLNPGESVAVQRLATSDGELPVKPDVTVRGKGVTGIERGAPSLMSPEPTPWSSRISYFTHTLFLVISCALIVKVAGWSYDILGWLQDRVEASRKRFKVKVEFDGEDRIRVTTLEGQGKSDEPVVLLPYRSHCAIGYTYEEFRKLGEGAHIIQKQC